MIGGNESSSGTAEKQCWTGWYATTVVSRPMSQMIAAVGMALEDEEEEEGRKRRGRQCRWRTLRLCPISQRQTRQYNVECLTRRLIQAVHVNQGGQRSLCAL